MADVTQNAESWFDGLGSAAQGGGGNWFEPGTYKCAIVMVTRKVGGNNTNKGHKLIVAELKILEVLVALPADANYGATKRVGEVCGVVCDLNSAFPYLDMGRLKGLLDAAHGPPDPEIHGVGDAGWMKLAAAVTEPPGTALADMEVLVTATKKTTTKGKHISPVTFSAAPAPAGA